MNKKELAEFSQLCIDTWCEDSEDKAKTLVLAAKMLLFAESIKKTLAQSSIDYVARQGKATKQRTDWISEAGETYIIYPAIKKGTEIVKVSVL